MKNEKKNIDRLFQEKFQNFEVFPEASAWQNIEKEILKKKKKRVVPLWMRLSGAAAILLFVGFSAYQYFSQNTAIPETKQEEIITKTDQNEGIPNNTKLDKKTKTIPFKDEQLKEKDNIVKNKQQKNQFSLPNKNYKTSIRNDKIVKNKNTVETPIITDSSQKLKESQQQKLDFNQEKGYNTKIVVQQLKGKDEVSKSLENKKDIHQELQDREINKDEIANINTNKWSIGSTVSPIYYNTLNSGSPIDPSLVNNTKTSINSISYGLKLSYKLSDKLSFQSGINNLELGYTTANVATFVSSSLLNNTSTNISTHINGVSIAAVSTEMLNFDSSQGRSSFDTSGNLSQTFNYIEIPMEVKYSLLQKKLGINILGGFSTYYLYQNSVSARSFGKTTSLGEATNLNALNFSGNLGVDVEYNLSKKLFINISPMFKYQFNTFSNESGGFQPYYLGVYTGLNFRF